MHFYLYIQSPGFQSVSALNSVAAKELTLLYLPGNYTSGS